MCIPESANQHTAHRFPTTSLANMGLPCGISTYTQDPLKSLWAIFGCLGVLCPDTMASLPPNIGQQWVNNGSKVCVSQKLWRTMEAKLGVLIRF
mmetsp:Transcript_9209/g.14110  ORF Transcript_9209/g.14110 Transcript_9209/m.14110 type:complete len:94 (+) Transcript_9209:187-468(+)